ncbi:hypothetical protein XnspCFBP7698_06825 [Xanthomonas sp. CFBP 7698]|nr:hypothetical protein XnspCFBP7698_06825 [Xanthomonas sp. CFBP 7698]
MTTMVSHRRDGAYTVAGLSHCGRLAVLSRNAAEETKRTQLLRAPGGAANTPGEQSSGGVDGAQQPQSTQCNMPHQHQPRPPGGERGRFWQLYRICLLQTAITRVQRCPARQYEQAFRLKRAGSPVRTHVSRVARPASSAHSG